MRRRVAEPVLWIFLCFCRSLDDGDYRDEFDT